mmetsp:Transcript_63686/g.127952  ORF Transcript_63686/g.127952 Transcript_63686/m.127952 type:complete len:232 (+) Transcript_63686:139-834(+)
MRFSNRRRMAGSSSHGTLVAPSTSSPSIWVDTPCICTRNSVLTLREDSDSPSDRDPHMESISSMKMMACSSARASSNKFFTSFSDSPCHLLMRSLDEMAKNLASASVATAFAKKLFPVPGGPYSKMPRHGRRFPTKSWGNLLGRITASFSASLAPSNPATSSHLTLGFSVTMAPSSWVLSLAVSLSTVSSLSPFLGVAVAASPPPPPPAGGLLGPAAAWSSTCLSCSALSM